MDQDNKSKKTSKSAVKATIWYVISDFLLRGISVITMPLFTRLLSTTEIGKYSILSSWISILSITVTLNLVPSVLLARFDYKDKLDNYVSTVSELGIISASLFCAIGYALKSPLAKLFGLDDYAFTIMLIHIVFCQASSILLAKYRANLEYEKSVIFSFGSTIIVTLIAVVCTVVFEDRLQGRVYGTYGTKIIINVIIFAFILFRRHAFKIEYCK